MTAIEMSKYPIRDAFRGFYGTFLKSHPGLDAEKRKAAECIMKCKTYSKAAENKIILDCTLKYT